MSARLLSALDAAAHRITTPLCNFKMFGRWHVPGWGYVQLWQWHLCNAVERAMDREAGR